MQAGGSMEDREELRIRMKDLFSVQKLAVLSTQSEGQPYASLVSFVATDDLKHLLFATSRATRKYANLAADARAALLIDSRSNRDSDLQRAIAVTATGTVDEIQGKDRDRLVGLYLKKHSSLDEFVNSPSNALLRMKVESYVVVRRFQNVITLQPSE
jgi:nitroimidazol reductase NimA-like FMN-containing flavoprotein (pyridoxamine 5'-phosphate oxidase superfamily)